MTDLPLPALPYVPSERGLFWRRFARDPKACAGAAIVLVLVAIAILAPVLAPYPFDDTDLLGAWEPPSAAHWVGTDKLGRDILSRLLFGARTSLTVSVSVLAITLVVGITLGMLAGYLGGWVDAAVSRLIDIIFAFPDVVFAILPPLIVRASIGIGFIIMSEATLSLLGLGVQEPQPSWGSMIRDGLEALRTDPYLALSGSAMLAVTIIGFNLLGDGLRDLLDPKLQVR